MRWLSSVLVTFGLATVAGIAVAAMAAPKAARDTTAVTVRVTEWEFTLSRDTVPVGTVVFTVVNDGREPHDFSIAGRTTPLLSGGQSATLTVTFAEPGSYVYVSTHDDVDREMYGSLQVTGSAATTARTQPLPLEGVADLPLPGGSSRFDYQSLDPRRHRLFISHLGAGSVVVVDVARRRVVHDVSGVPGAHGVLAVPALGRVYASATDAHQLVVIRESTLTVTGRTSGGSYPDGIAYDPGHRRVFVSDKTGDAEVVVDTRRLHVVRRIAVGGEAGNVKYDSTGRRMFVAVAEREQLVAIDPARLRVVARYALPGCSGAHGLQLDPPRRLAFVACEQNARLLVSDLKTHRVTATLGVGDIPDVLAFDPGLRRLYVAAESGVVAVFDEQGRTLRKLGQALLAPTAHSVAVDPATHLVYFPLEAGPVLRIMTPRRSAGSR